MIDSHCHLDHAPLFENLQDVINRAKSVGVNQFLTICTSIKSFENIKKIILNYKDVFGTVGIHPHETKLHKDISKSSLIKLKSNYNKIIGIGETGLDYYYNHSDKNIQKEIFIEHIDAAKKLNIPLIVHSRNAESDTFDILKSHMNDQKLKVIIHCFAGGRNFAKKLINIGCYISISGIITFKNSNLLAEAVSFIPINKLLVETDSPYLSPIPNRGQNNEPSFITHTIEKLSIIKNMNKKVIIENTTNNFKKLFNLK